METNVEKPSGATGKQENKRSSPQGHNGQRITDTGGDSKKTPNPTFD